MERRSGSRSPSGDFFTIQRAAEILHMSERTLWRRIGVGEITVNKSQRWVRISATELRRYKAETACRRVPQTDSP